MTVRLCVLMTVLLTAGCTKVAAIDVFAPATPQEVDAMPAAAKQALDRIRQQPTTRSASVVRIAVDTLAQPSVTLPLRADLRAEATEGRIERRSATDFTWYGTLAATQGSATLVVRDNQVTGTIRDGAALYRIRPLGNGLHALIEVDASRFPADDPPEARLERRPAGPLLGPRRVSTAVLDRRPVVNVLVGYTRAAEIADPNIASTIQLAIDETNQSYRNSRINLQVRLAHVYRANYTESGRSFPMIVHQFAAAGDGELDEVHRLRGQYGADVAVLLIDQSAFCGRALTVRAGAISGFVTVHYDCATGNYSFGHEIGHLQGARHNPEADSTTTPFAYGHGFLNGSSWRTIMAYDCTPGCPRLQYWSNPNVTYGGAAMGTAGTHDNARVLGETTAAVVGFRPTSGEVWRYTGAACSGDSCPGWERLDNNPKTVSIVAGGDTLYQLHNDGWIWQHTGTPCDGNACPGWQRLDNNPKTMAIVAGGSTLYQLHNDGWIWRYTGTPCSGDFCPGWQRLDNNSKTVGIVADGDALYQLHNDGWIWRYTGTPCSSDSCPGWQRLDNNAKTSALAAGGGALYQLHNDGWIWRYTGTPCSGDSCPGWLRLDNNSKTIGIAAGGSALYQLHNDGWIWRYTGTPCSGNLCPGWQRLDNNPKTMEIVASSSALYQLHDDGWIWRYTGTPCSGSSCPGWERLDNNPRTEIIAANQQLYQLH